MKKAERIFSMEAPPGLVWPVLWLLLHLFNAAPKQSDFLQLMLVFLTTADFVRLCCPRFVYFYTVFNGSFSNSFVTHLMRPSFRPEGFLVQYINILNK